MIGNPTIEQMNLVIADFMGYYYNAGKFYQKSHGRGNWFKEAKYHLSWDALMPVVEKIESIYDEFHGYFGVHISSNSCCIQGTKLDARPGKEHYAYFNEVVLSNKKEATHYAVYQFIQWYNKQQSNE